LKNFNIHLNRNGTPIFGSGFKLPGQHSVFGFFIQSHAQGADYTRVVHAAIRTHHDLQDDHALILGLARFFRKLRLGSIDCFGSVYPRTAAPEHSRTNTRAASGTHTATATTADAASDPASVRRHHQFRQRIADLVRLRNLEVGNHSLLNL